MEPAVEQRASAVVPQERVPAAARQERAVAQAVGPQEPAQPRSAAAQLVARAGPVSAGGRWPAASQRPEPEPGSAQRALQATGASSGCDATGGATDALVPVEPAGTAPTSSFRTVRMNPTLATTARHAAAPKSTPGRRYHGSGGNRPCHRNRARRNVFRGAPPRSRTPDRRPRRPPTMPEVPAPQVPRLWAPPREVSPQAGSPPPLPDPAPRSVPPRAPRRSVLAAMSSPECA